MAAKKQSAAQQILASENGLAMVEALLAKVAAAEAAPTAPKEHVLCSYENRGATETVILPRPLEADEQQLWEMFLAHGCNNSWVRNALAGTRIMDFEIRVSTGSSINYKRAAMGDFFYNEQKRAAGKRR